jgi:hypothetical protein
MIQLHDFLLAKIGRIFPMPPLSLDCLEVGQRFRVCTVRIRPILRMLLCHGISEHQSLSVLSRNQYWIEVGTEEDSRSITLSFAQAKHILVQRI